MLFPTLRPSSLPVVVAQPDKDMQTEQLQCWSGMIDMEHSATSGSNEEEEEAYRSMRCLNTTLFAPFLERLARVVKAAEKQRHANSFLIL